ncbi:hypothetical protein B0H16DRAFT_1308783, partial [Mycena metata]
NIQLVQVAVQSQWGKAPTPALIWKSIRHKDLSRQVKTFLWKGIHGAHRTGKYWKHIPDCEDREFCQNCGVTELLEHILIECDSPGRGEVWSLVEKMWLKKQDYLPLPSVGGILGCALASFEDENRSKPSGLFGNSCNRLFRIMISESAYLIWKLRNERVIVRVGVPHTTTEIHNRWVRLMNDRLEVDCFLANKTPSAGRKLVSPMLVLQTWSRVLN